MRKIFAFLLCVCMFAAMLAVGAGAADVMVSNQKVLVDGVEKNFEVYNIDGSNYFKLRDIAYVVNDTGSQFSVGYDNKTRTITATSGEAYAPLGTEMATGVDNSASAVVSSQYLLINGEYAEITAYNIGGSNFFKLRELGALLNFVVDYDDAARCVLINTAPKAEKEEVGEASGPLTVKLDLKGSCVRNGLIYAVNYMSTATASGGTGDYEYYFEIIKNGAMSEYRAYGSDNTYRVNFGGAGVCLLRVTVRDSAGTTAQAVRNLIVTG